MSSTLDKLLAACRNPKAFHHLHRFAVVNLMTDEPIEGHYSLDEASRAARDLDEHETRCDAAGCRPNGKAHYVVRPIEA